MSTSPDEQDLPFHRIGGEARVRAIAARFYDAMDELEPELARLHELDAQGKVASGPRERFALFFIGWLGGPQDYMARYGHPRLRMRHARVQIDARMRDAWMRCMRKALDDEGVTGELRAFLDTRLHEVADMLRNRPGLTLQAPAFPSFPAVFSGYVRGLT